MAIQLANMLVAIARRESGLGDNTRALRDALRADDLLRLAVSSDQAVAVVLGHTRWASVGIDYVPTLAAQVGLAVAGIHPIGKRVVASLAVA